MSTQSYYRFGSQLRIVELILGEKFNINNIPPSYSNGKNTGDLAQTFDVHYLVANIAAEKNLVLVPSLQRIRFYSCAI